MSEGRAAREARVRALSSVIGPIGVLLVGGACSDGTTPLGSAEVASRTAQALAGERVRPDANGMNERATVRLRNLGIGDGGPTFCTGTLLTTRIILTSAHCLESVSWENAVAELDYDRPSQFPGGTPSREMLQLPIQRTPRPTLVPWSESILIPDDVMLLFVGPNESSGVGLGEMPDEVVHTRMPYLPYRRGPGRVGMAAFETFVSEPRAFVDWDDIELSGGIWRYATPSDAFVRKGNSGAPLFVTEPDGRRAIFGVLAHHDNYNSDSTGGTGQGADPVGAAIDRVTANVTSRSVFTCG